MGAARPPAGVREAIVELKPVRPRPVVWHLFYCRAFHTVSIYVSQSMRSPSIVPATAGDATYIVLDDLGDLGTAYRETDPVQKQLLSDHCPVSVRLTVPD